MDRRKRILTPIYPAVAHVTTHCAALLLITQHYEYHNKEMVAIAHDSVCTENISVSQIAQVDMLT